MGLDGLKAYALVQQAAAAHGGIVGPPVWWHVHETPRGVEWLAQQNANPAYMTCMPADIFLHQLVYQLRAAEGAGFKAAVCVTGHYGGIEVDMKMVCDIYAKHRPLRTAALADWEAIEYKDYHGDHAGICETSQLWALRPGLVDISRIPEEGFNGRRFASTADARSSSRSEGEKIIESQVAFLGRLGDRLLADAGETGELIPHEEAEAIWDEILACRPDWISTHGTDGFHEYVQKRRQEFRLPV
jgi:creatinine amidohydrolase/Fe(II)-dependent formamide hydrolase-like protein